MSDFLLYGGTEMDGSEVDLDLDLIPIRDASLIDNAKHRKISPRQLLAAMNVLVPSVVVSADNPTTETIGENRSAIWFNTTINQVRNWANVQGTLWRSPLWSIFVGNGFTADSTLVTADSTIPINS